MMWLLTAVFAVCTAVAAYFLAHGDPSAINGVVGAGLGTVVLGALAIIERNS